MGSVGGGGAGLVSGDGSGRFSVAARSRSIAAFPAVLIPARALGFGDVGGCWPQAVPHHMTAIIPVSMMKRRVRRVRLFRDPKPGWCWILSFARSGTAGMSDKAMGRRAGGAETGCWCGRDIGQIRSRMIRRVMLVPTAWHNREGSKLPLWCWGDPCAPIGVPEEETGRHPGNRLRNRIFTGRCADGGDQASKSGFGFLARSSRAAICLNRSRSALSPAKARAPTRSPILHRCTLTMLTLGRERFGPSFVVGIGTTRPCRL